MGGSSESCAELEIRDVDWTGAVRTGAFVSAFQAHSLGREPCVPGTVSAPKQSAKDGEEETGP